MAVNCRIAADIGGTFTDIAFVAEGGRLVTRKIPSTPDNYADAVIEGIDSLMGAQGRPLSEIDEILHGCTIATNAILEHKGAETALLTTEGFRDVLELRRIRVPRLYDPLYVKPPPLAPRRLRFEVEERIGAHGEIVVPLNEADVARAIERIREEGTVAVAVCLLHSYANPIHERRIGEILKRELPDVFISLSCEVLPQIREYERTSTTVVNAYVGPPVKAYVRSMIDQLAAAGIRGRLMVMQSSGGILDGETVIETPAHIVECGPAAGVIGAAHAGALNGYDNLITLDMGGTTAKASIIEAGEITISDEIEVGGEMSTGNALVAGGGYALKLPAIQISEVGAGGGSVVWLDMADSIKVGPHSAGAVPGPACYGAGGEEPTITDANVVLGFLNPMALVGGSLPIDARLSRKAIEDRIARPLGRELVETAYGIHVVANVNMMRAIKAVTTYRGRDPRDFALFAFGGNGGVHAIDLARGLQVGRVIVPPAAGVFSAVGLLFADMEMNLAHAFMHRVDAMPLDEAEQAYREMEDDISSRLNDGYSETQFQRLADLRYVGQAFELTVALPEGAFDAAVKGLGRRFEAEHKKRYGHAFEGAYPVETVNLRVIGTVPTQSAGHIGIDGSDAAAEDGGRPVYFGPEFGFVETPVITRAALTPERRAGPMIVEEYDGTTVVPPDCLARLDPQGNIIIDVGSGA